LLRALLLQVLYSVRSERMLMEQLDYSLLFRWFVGLNMDDPIWDVTVFTKNRQRLLAGDIAEAFFVAVLKQARQRSLLSDEHFTVDGTLLEAWAGQKSFRRVDDDHQPPTTRTGEGSNPTVNLSPREAQQPNPLLDHRPRCHAFPQESRQRRSTGLSRPSADREPERSGGFDTHHASVRFGGTRCRVADG
jgi:hypothetical protein